LRDIGFVIVDEAHVATLLTFTNTLLKFCPKYLLGLSATPKRPDGLHRIFPLYFGTEYVVRFETKNFNVIKVETPFKPKIEHHFVNGRAVMNWSVVINSLSTNEERQNLAVSLAIKHADQRIMILCNRVEQCIDIYNKLLSKKQHTEILVGKTKKWDKSCRILVAGTKKAGVGFNDPTLTMLILLSDTKDVAQFEGRIRTTDNIIYDIVDDNKTLENHWETRKKWYEKRGATIHTLSMRTDLAVPSKRYLGKNTDPVVE
jgi:superfamily II DNA or RNA helicase